MIYKFEPILAEVAMQVLQELAFVFAEPLKHRELSQKASFSDGAMVEFSGPLSGKIAVIATKSMVAEITANMLGVEKSQVTAGQQNDALGEVANVLCGNLLPRLSGTDAVVDVHPPETADADTLGNIGQDDNNAVMVTLGADEGQCKVLLVVKNQGNKDL